MLKRTLKIMQATST
jgi:tRNA-dihydrouridine synthase 1